MVAVVAVVAEMVMTRPVAMTMMVKLMMVVMLVVVVVALDERCTNTPAYCRLQQHRYRKQT